MDKGKFMIDCDICGAKDTVSPLLARNQKLQGCPILFYECSDCGSDYTDSKVTQLNKIMALHWRKNP